MVEKVYIVWCKLNKSTAKFDLGVFTNKQKADYAEENHTQGINSKVWVSLYKLSKPLSKG